MNYGEEDFKAMRASEHYKGWWDLLDRAYAFIEEQRKNGPVEILQVKEKFGGLRMYVTGLLPDESETFWKLLDESYKLCERCGQPGQLYGGGWLTVFCPTHAAEAGRDQPLKDPRKVVP